ncbi:hypothetical protein [Candidatus Leptofilum sp.]|uniref:hypothetical protein n=1 Tax=Candidatus Leptofilum sp. TaxID=3241576 RepID=UPI003B594B94
MNVTNTQEVLNLIDTALRNNNPQQIGEALATLSKLEPDRWITLLHINNIIPDADQRNTELAEILPILLEGLAYAMAEPGFPLDGFTNLLYPLLTLNISFSSISKSLNSLNVWEKPVINLIARIVGFLEDQTDIALDRSSKITGKNGYHDTRFLLSDEIDTVFNGPMTNVVAGYEEHCENLQLILAYSIYRYRTDYWGEIKINRTPYEDIEFSKLVTLASIWRRYKDLWAKTKYFGWRAIKIKGMENEILFIPKDEEEQIRFEIGGIRAQFIFAEISSFSLSAGLDQSFSDNYDILSKLANNINLPKVGKPWKIELDSQIFKKVTSNLWDKFYWETIFQIAYFQKIIDLVQVGSRKKHI